MKAWFVKYGFIPLNLVGSVAGEVVAYCFTGESSLVMSLLGAGLGGGIWSWYTIRNASKENNQ